MADDHHHGDIIIVKKKSGGGHGHHGGAWKIAFADFMTAMMAFFLVLWIINATDKSTKTVIARYFNPVKLENPAKAKKGVHGATASPTEGKEEKSDKAVTASPSDKVGGAAVKGEEKPDPKEAPKPQSAKAEAKLQAAEAELFTAPYETLERIAGGPGQAAPGASPDKGDADPQRLAGALSIESFRDPFKPIGPGAPDDPVAFDADARNKMSQDTEPQKAGEDAHPREKPAPNAPSTPGPHEKAAGETAKSAAALGGDDAKAGDESKLEKEIKEKVEAALNQGKGPEIEVRQTKDGLLISLTDKLDFSMFAVGSATPQAELVRAMDAVGKIVKARAGHIIVRGHTDEQRPGVVRRERHFEQPLVVRVDLGLRGERRRLPAA